MHGGSTPIKHGNRSLYKAYWKTKLGDLVEEFENVENPLDITPELAVARALLTDYIARYEENNTALMEWYRTRDDEGARAPRPERVLDLVSARGLLAEVTKIAKRIEDIRAQYAISRVDFWRLMTEMGRVVDNAVEDERARERIRSGWREIRLP